MERWWNCVVEVTVPFDTSEEAKNAVTDDETIDRLFEIFGNNALDRRTDRGSDGGGLGLRGGSGDPGDSR